MKDFSARHARSGIRGQTTLLMALVCVFFCCIVAEGLLRLTAFDTSRVDRRLVRQSSRDGTSHAIELVNQLFISGVIRGFVVAGTGQVYWTAVPNNGTYWSMNPGYTKNSGLSPTASVDIFTCVGIALGEELLLSFSATPLRPSKCLGRLVTVSVVDSVPNGFMELNAIAADQTTDLPNFNYWIRQKLGLLFSGSYYDNYWGMNERWMSSTSGNFYAIRFNGELREWRGSTAATLDSSALLFQLTPAYYDDPSLLWNAPP